MRRLIITLISLALTLSFSQSASAAVKTGAKCKKAGQVSISAGKQFICVKQGKNLVWGKGKVIKQSAPVPSISPTPTPSATPTPQPSPSVTASAEPTRTPTPTPTPSPTKEISQYALATQQFLDEVWKRNIKSSSKYSVFIEPARADSKWAKQHLLLMEATLDMLAKLGYPATTEFKVYIGWDWNWIQQYLPKQSWCYNGSWAGGGFCGDGINFINLKHTAEWQRSGDQESEWRSEPEKFQGTATLSHEVAHQAQGDYLQKFNRNTSFYPAWIREGTPEVIKTYAYAKAYNLTYLEVRELYLKMTEDKCQFVKLNNLLNAGNHPDGCQGVLGLLAVEALIGTTKNASSSFSFGESKIAGFGPLFDVERDGISNETYRFVMKEMFGIDVATWHPVVEKEFEKWAPPLRG